MPDAAQELLDLNQKLLDAIASGDWKTYEELCDPSITCFEPEALGHLVEGLPFHRFYFELPSAGPAPKSNTTMVAPHVRMLSSDAAVVSYVRLTQRVQPNAGPLSVRQNETRVWQRRDGRWRHVHFHRSPCG
jgi:hypothetical protein